MSTRPSRGLFVRRDLSLAVPAGDTDGGALARPCRSPGALEPACAFRAMWQGDRYPCGRTLCPVRLLVSSVVLRCAPTSTSQPKEPRHDSIPLNSLRRALLPMPSSAVIAAVVLTLGRQSRALAPLARPSEALCVRDGLFLIARPPGRLARQNPPPPCRKVLGPAIVIAVISHDHRQHRAAVLPCAVDAELLGRSFVVRPCHRDRRLRELQYSACAGAAVRSRRA